MQLTTLLTAALLPLGLIAAPVVEGDAADIAAREPAPGVSASDKADALARLKRDIQICFIEGGASSVNCRSGPGTNYKVVTTVKKGNLYWFSCVKSGECVTINGAKNCGWDYAMDLGCYVNGHYTDNDCTLAKLGRC